MKLVKKLSLAFTAAAIVAPASYAADLSIEIENLTRGTFFTPLAVTAHPDGTSLFSSGAAASTEIQAMAEGGSLTGIETFLTGIGATQDIDPAGGLLVPGASTTASLNTDGTTNILLSVVGMMLPTNDGFVAINAINIPTTAGTHVFFANAYDAGTEANDEVVGSGDPGMAGFPAPAPVAATTGTSGAGVAATAEGFIHIHRGVLGDTNATGGDSDIDSTMHRWLNPVAKISITVN